MRVATASRIRSPPGGETAPSTRSSISRRPRPNAARSAAWMRGERVDDRGDRRRPARSSASDQRRDRFFVADLAERVGGRRRRASDRRAAGRAAARSTRVADARERVDAPETRERNRATRRCRASGSIAAGARKPAERLDRVEAHVGIGIVERAQKSASAAAGWRCVAERERGLHAQVGVRVAAAARRAAPSTSTPVSVSSCSALLSTLKLRWPSRSADDQRRRAPRRAGGEGLTAARRTRQSSSPSPAERPTPSVGSSGASCSTASSRTAGRRRAARGQLALALEPRRDVLDASRRARRRARRRAARRRPRAAACARIRRRSSGGQGMR